MLKVIHLDLLRVIYIDRLVVWCLGFYRIFMELEQSNPQFFQRKKEMIYRRQVVRAVGAEGSQFQPDRLGCKPSKFIPFGPYWQRALIKLGFYVAEEIEILRFDLIIVFEYLGALFVAHDILESISWKVF